ncbi:SAP domain-containing protein, partial [Durusdinium trenchii]
MQRDFWPVGGSAEKYSFGFGWLRPKRRPKGPRGTAAEAPAAQGRLTAEKLLGKQVFSHPHSAVFNAWLKRHRVNLEVPEVPDSDHWMVSGVERLTKQLGEKKFKEMIREVFLGGEERIQELTEWFTKKTNDGISFAIITAGVASTVSMALEAVPEWDRFFPTDLVLDLSGSRHQVLSVTGQKALMLRDLRPTATRLVLVDDSLSVGPRSKPGKHL